MFLQSKRKYPSYLTLIFCSTVLARRSNECTSREWRYWKLPRTADGVYYSKLILFSLPTRHTDTHIQQSIEIRPSHTCVSESAHAWSECVPLHLATMVLSTLPKVKMRGAAPLYYRDYNYSCKNQLENNTMSGFLKTHQQFCFCFNFQPCIKLICTQDPFT